MAQTFKVKFITADSDAGDVSVTVPAGGTVHSIIVQVSRGGPHVTPVGCSGGGLHCMCYRSATYLQHRATTVCFRGTPLPQVRLLKDVPANSWVRCVGPKSLRGQRVVAVAGGGGGGTGAMPCRRGSCGTARSVRYATGIQLHANPAHGTCNALRCLGRVICAGRELYEDDPVSKATARVLHCMLSDTAPQRPAPQRKLAPPPPPPVEPPPPVDWVSYGGGRPLRSSMPPSAPA